MKWQDLTTEQGHTDSSELDRLTPLEAVLLMNRFDREVAEAVATVAPEIARAVEQIGATLADGGRLIYVGAGTSGRLGVLDAAECVPTFSVDANRVTGIIAGGERALREPIEGAEDDEAEGGRVIDRQHVGTGDVVVGLSASGSAPYVMGALRAARLSGAFSIGVANNRPALLESECDLAIVVVTGPEILTGSTRLKAGTAQKMVLNMLSTLGMVRAGKTLGNLMVDVRPTNAKLRDRARRILRTVTGCSETEAADLLEQSGGRVKTALVMQCCGADLITADRWLEEAGGFVRKAIDRGAGTLRTRP